MGVFYTRKGDRGKSYIGKKSVPKTCLEVEALGQVDELTSMLGVLKSDNISVKLKRTIHEIQENLFTIQSHIANIMLDDSFRVPQFKSSKISEVENIIDHIENNLPPLKKFVVPGSNRVSAWLDLLRAKSRNVERLVLRIKRSHKLSPEIKAYLNRLSSLFFALARWESRHKKEKNPTYK